MKNSITIYTLNNCSICNFLKGELKERKKEYEEIKIDENGDIGDKFEKNWGVYKYPIFIITNNKNQKTIFLQQKNLDTPNNVITFDINNIKKILDKYEI